MANFAAMHEGEVQLDVCVKLKGLPFKATAEDITSFFTGFVLASESILLKRHPDGRPNGEAFVAFATSDEARRATQKDREVFGEKFGDRYVRVYPVLDSDMQDMQAALQQSASSQQGNGLPYGHTDSVIKIKSLPFDATQLDIIQFFEGFRLKPNGVQLVVRSDNKPTGEAFVDFESVEEAARSVRERDHKVFSEKFGDRYVRLIQVSRKEMQATLALRFGGEGILKMKGIPFKAAASDVRKFFASGNYRIKPDGISFIMHADGRPTGMAFIEFETPQDAVRAMEKDRAKFGPEYGDRFCMLQLVGRHEMAKVTLQKESECVGPPGGNNGLTKTASLNMLQHLHAAALGNPSLMGNSLLLNNPWLNLMNAGLINPGDGVRQLGLVNGAGLSHLGLGHLGQLQGMGGGGSSVATSLAMSSAVEHLSQLQHLQSLGANSSPMMDALMAGQQLQLSGQTGLGGLLQNQQMSMMPPSTGTDAEDTPSWMMMSQQSSQPLNLASAASSLLMYRQHQQQHQSSQQQQHPPPSQAHQDWVRAEAREYSAPSWTDQFAAMHKHGHLAGSTVTI